VKTMLAVSALVGLMGVLPAFGGDAPDRKRDTAAFEAAAGSLAAAELPEGVRAPMLTTLRQHPTETQWSGRAGKAIFAVAVRPLPSGPIRDRAVPAFLQVVHSLAVSEMLTAKSLLDHYAAAGLTDATVLRQAVLQVSGQLGIAGKSEGFTHQAKVQGEFAVAYVIADEGTLATQLLQPAELATVKTAYREAMHKQARELMERKKWQDAVLLWHHLHTRKLVSQALYLDAATCFVELKKPGDALKVLEEAYAAFSATASADWLEQCGDLACKLGKPGESLALQAYQRASATLMNTTSDRARGKLGIEPQPAKR